MADRGSEGAAATVAERNTLTITREGDRRLNEKLHLADDGTVWLVYTFPLTDENGDGDDFDTESVPLGQIGKRGLWKAVPHQLLGALEDLEDEWEARQVEAIDGRGEQDFAFWLGIEGGRF